MSKSRRDMAEKDRLVDEMWRAHRKRYMELVTSTMVGRYTSARRPVEYAILRNDRDGSTYPTPLRVHARHLQNRPRPLGRAVRAKLVRRGGRRR